MKCFAHLLSTGKELLVVNPELSIVKIIWHRDGEGGKTKHNSHLRGNGLTMLRLRRVQAGLVPSPRPLGSMRPFSQWETRSLGVAWAAVISWAGFWALGFAARPVHRASESTGPQMGPKGLTGAESDSLKVIFLHLRFIS